MVSINLQLRLILIIFSIVISMGCMKDLSSGTSKGQCKIKSNLDKKNRDGKFPKFPLKEDSLVKSSFIYKAHEIIGNGMKQWLNLDEAEFGIYLNYIVSKNNNITYLDEYSQPNTALDRQLFNFIWEQYNETLCENYAVKQFKKDQLNLCKTAEILSHQPKVLQRETIITRIGAALRYKQCDRTNLEKWERKNRDGQLPTLETVFDTRQSDAIVEAHEILRKSLQQFLGFQDRNLGTYLSYIINERTESFVDEYGKLITSYEKVFRSIWEQYNETQVHNYALKQFENDKLDVCSVARFLSHQTAVENRINLMKRVGDALVNRCHPCTPYMRKELGGTQVLLNTDSIIIQDITPEKSLEICKTSTTTPTTKSWNPEEYVDTHSKYDWYDGEKGKVKWAQGCDFKGNDFSCVTSMPQLCGGLCVDDSRCTHFTYYYGNGTCCLKTAPKSTEVSPLDAVCGQLLEKFPPFPST